MDEFDDYLKSQKVDDVRSKIYQAAASARKRGVNIPDDVADEFYDAMSHESGRSHFNRDGSVKFSGLPINGERAIGFSQVMPGTASPYSKEGLDPLKEADNIEIGLREFYKGDPNDSVGRRLAYVGGQGSGALKQYRQTGKVSTARMYPSTNSKETYADYVEGTSGYKSFDNYLKNQNAGGKQGSVAEKSDPSDPFDDYLKNQTIEQPKDLSVGQALTGTTNLATGEFIPNQPNAGSVPPPVAPKLGVPINPANTIKPTTILPPNIVAPPKITATGLPLEDQADLANVGSNQVGQTAFGATYTPPVVDEYTQWLDYQRQSNPNIVDSPETQAQFQKAVDENAAFGKDVTVSAPQQPARASQISQTSNATAARATGQPAQPNTAQSYALGTANNTNLSPVATYDVDLSQKPDGISASDYANRIALQRTGQFSDAEIDDYLKATPQTTHYDQLTAAELKRIGSIPVTVRQGTIDEILARRPEMQRQAENERQLLESAKADDDLFNEAKQQLIDERDDHNVMSGTGGLGSYVGDTIGQFIGGAKSDPTQSEILERFEEIKKLRLDNEAVNRAVEVGNQNEQSFGGQLLGALYGASGRGMQSAAGVARPLASLGITSPYEWLSKTGSEMQLSGQTSNGKTWSGTAADLAVGLPVDLLRLNVMSKLPGGMVMAFAADSALQSAGRGDSLREVQKQGTKGAAIGALFPASSIVGKAVGGQSAVLETVARLGTIGAGTTGIELAAGTPVDKALQSGLMNVLFDAVPTLGKKLYGKVGRIWSKGEAREVAIDDQGNVSLVKFKDQANPNRVDFEMVIDPTDGVYKEAGEVSVNRGKRIGETVAPRELLGENPKRIETAQPEAVEKITSDSRAQKIVENLRDGKTYTVEQLQKATKYNKTNVEDALLTLYSAKQIEILPDDSVRFIGGESAITANKSLFERAAEIETPKQTINLPPSSIENGIDSSDSYSEQPALAADNSMASKPAERVTEQSVSERITEAPIVESPTEAGKLVRVGDQEVQLSPEQSARWKTEVEQPLKNAERKRSQSIAQNPRFRDTYEREYKGTAMRIAARKREIAGLLTPTEQRVKDRRDASNYNGKTVSVNGRNGKVTGTAFGRVKVRFEDGAEQRFAPSEISAPISTTVAAGKIAEKAAEDLISSPNDAPLYSRPDKNIAPQNIRERILTRKVKELAAADTSLDVLLSKAKAQNKDGATLLNPEATEYARRTLGEIYGDGEQSAFLGGYLKPVHIEMVRNYLANDLPNRAMRPFAKERAVKILQTLTDGADAVHGDNVMLTVAPESPEGLIEARQEEFAHRADARTRGAIDPESILSNPAARKAADALKANLYEDVSEASLAQEVIAKTFRSDAESELNLTDAELKTVELDYWRLLSENGITKEQIKSFESVSEKGKEFVKNAENTRFSSTDAIENGRSGQTEALSNDGSGREARRNGSENSPRFAERKTGFDGIGVDEGSSGNNESLIKSAPVGIVRTAERTREAILYSRPSSVDVEETAAEVKSATKTILSYLYDGKTDVSPTEAAMNIMRTGYLAGISVLKTNLLGNSTNIVVEQLAKPLMATADILNPKAKTRTTPGLSARDVIQGFFGENGLFRSEVGFNKADIGRAGILKSGVSLKNGFLKALVSGVDHQESARVDMNLADKNTNFVRNTGVPLIDVVIEATKRVVTGVDRPFKAYARSAERSGLARLEASKDSRGLGNAIKNTVDLEWRRRMLQIRRDPSRLINDVAERYAEVVTFQNPNAVTQTYDKFRRFLIDEKAMARVIPTATQRKIAKYVGSAVYLGTGQMAPFMSTPSNVGFRTLEYFFPTGVVATAFKFHRIGKSLERQSFIEEEALRRAKIVKRLAAIRNSQDRAFNKETSEKTERLAAQKKMRSETLKRSIEDVKNSKVLTDAAKTTRIEQLRNTHEQWLAGWETNREKYLQTREDSAGKGVAQRKVVDDIQRKDWESEDAYADIKFSAFESRAFAEAAGRAGFGATVGSLTLLGVIYGLIKAVGTTDYDDEKEKAQAKRAAGIPNETVAIGGYRLPYGDAPFGNALAMGINLFEQYERPGSGLDRAGAMAKRFGKDVTSLNPLTAQEFTKDDWASYAGSKANSMTPILNLKILQEIGEVADDKPRKYWEEGFAAQYLIKIPKLREFLPESESFIGGEEERGDVWRRALRAVDPLKITKENSSQDDLPVTPLSKDAAPPDPGKDKKLDDAVRKGKISTEEATRTLTEDATRGDISPSQYKQRLAALSQSKAVKEMSDANADDERDFESIEKILEKAAPEDKPLLEKMLVDKAKAKLNSKTNKRIADGQKLLEIHEKYFTPE